MKNVLKKVFGVFGWVFFIFDVKNLFLSFIIHLAIIFFLMIAVYSNLGFWGVVAAFAFMYLGGAQILMIQRLGDANRDREAFDDAFEMRPDTEPQEDEQKPEETDQEPVSFKHPEA